MRIIKCLQGSDEWHKTRLGIPTASQFFNIITPSGLPVKAERRTRYMCRLITERVLQQSLDDERGDRLYWARRGQTVEPQARADFELTVRTEVEQVGCIVSDDGRYAASPDGILTSNGKRAREGLEMKCPAPWNQMEYLLHGPGDDFTPQVQGEMFVGGFDAMHLWCWHPSMPPKHVVTLRDDDYMDRLATALFAFCDELDKETARALELGPYKIAEHLRIAGEMVSDLPGVFPWLQ